MDARRISGALLTAFSTGAGVMVPYTFKTMTPFVMAVIWACIVFAGLIGVILALYPTSSDGPKTSLPDHHQPERRTLPDDDRELVGLLKYFAFMAIFILGPLLIIAAFQMIVRGLAILSS